MNIVGAKSRGSGALDELNEKTASFGDWQSEELKKEAIFLVVNQYLILSQHVPGKRPIVQPLMRAFELFPGNGKESKSPGSQRSGGSNEIIECEGDMLHPGSPVSL
jgi:hypothetical protein